MEFRVLGPVEFRNADASLPLGGRRQQALLARLLLDLGRPVASARLIDDLWGESPPPTAAKMVQVHVSHLRKVLPPGVLVTLGAGYAVHAPPEALDLNRFERLRSEGREALDRGDAARAAARLREALALWRGPALAEFEEPFAAAEASRLEEARLICVEDRIEADLALGRHGDLTGELEALVARHPLRERLLEHLMLALYRAGRHADALAAYQRHRAELDETLGIVPSPRLVELHSEILQHSPALAPPPPAPAPAALGHDPGGVRYAATRDGVRLAYAIHGSGRPLVRVATWLTHLDLDWESPVWRHWLEGLGERHRMLRYDDRGCGRSDRAMGTLGLDQWVDDLATVVDDAGLEEFDLLGVSGGGATAVTYAVRHPERVRRVVLYGTYLRGRLRRDDPLQAKEGAAMNALVRTGWGSASPAYRRVFTNLFLPDGTEEQMRWFDELQRRTTDGETAALLREARDHLDATAIARGLSRPTLVLHARGDRMVPVAEARLVAELIPNARFEELASRNHILLSDEKAWAVFLGTVDEFLSGDER